MINQIQSVTINHPKRLQIKNMYRKSNGNTFTGKTELAKSFLVFTGSGHYTSASKKDWKFIQKVQGNSRVYFSNYIGQLHLFKKPLEIDYLRIICKELDTHHTKNLHPAIENGYEGEITRLFPKVNQNMIAQYKKFIDYLDKNYHLRSQQPIEMANYIDDIGPYLVVKTGLKKSVIPELPKLYLAPKKWREITWAINNNFIGPYPKNEKNIHYSWGDFNIKSLIKNNEDEGTILFLISKFIIIQEAWMDRVSCDSLKYFIDLVIDHNEKPINS